jgi:hypothetical protein
MRAFNVRLNGKLIDTVFYTPSKGETNAEAIENTRRSLINHDGYDSGIVVNMRRRTAVQRSQDTLLADRLRWLDSQR